MAKHIFTNKNKISLKDQYNLTKTEHKIYKLLYSKPNKIFSVKEIIGEVLCSKRTVIYALNNLEDKQLLPVWINRRRNKMSFKLLTRTPEQARADKEAVHKSIDYEKLSEEFENRFEENFGDYLTDGAKRGARKSNKTPTFIAVPSTVERVIFHWQSKESLSKMKIPVKDQNNQYMNPTKRFWETTLAIKKLIAGTAFKDTEFVWKNRKFTIDEIKLAIDRFHTAATSDRHKPLRKDSLKRLTMFDFIYNRFYKDESFRSQFLYFIENEPTPRMEIAGELPVEKFPALTKAIIKKAETTFRFDMSNWKTKNIMVIAANKLYDFWVKYEKSQQWTSPMGANGIVREFVDSLLEWSYRKETNKIMPQTLTQDWIFKVFEEYCFNMELIIKDEVSMGDEEDDDTLYYSEGIDKSEGMKEDGLRDPEIYQEPTTADLTNLAAKMFPDEEPKTEEELTWEQRINEKRLRAEKEHNQYENAPYD